MLTSRVEHNNLAAADYINLGVIKVWGAGIVKITEATITNSAGTYPLTPQHNLENQVSRFLESFFKYHNDPMFSHMLLPWGIHIC